MKPIHEMSVAEAMEAATRRELNRRMGRPLDAPPVVSGMATETPRPKKPAIPQPIDRTVELAPMLYALLEKYQVPRPVPELRFSTERQWRFDWAWPAYRVALEVEGGAWTQGRHTRGQGFLDDCEKYSEAAALGWRLIRVPPDQLLTLDTIYLVKRALAFVPPPVTAEGSP